MGHLIKDQWKYFIKRWRKRKVAITRDILRKVYTHTKEQLNLNGVVARNLGSIKAVEEAFEKLFDEYADRKYKVKSKKLDETINDLKKLNSDFINKNKELKATIVKIKDINCELNKEKAELNSKIDDLRERNNVLEETKKILKSNNERLIDENAYMKGQIEKLTRENEHLQEENDYHCKPWYEKIFG